MSPNKDEQFEPAAFEGRPEPKRWLLFGVGLECLLAALAAAVEASVCELNTFVYPRDSACAGPAPAWLDTLQAQSGLLNLLAAVVTPLAIGLVAGALHRSWRWPLVCAATLIAGALVGSAAGYALPRLMQPDYFGPRPQVAVATLLVSFWWALLSPVVAVMAAILAALGTWLGTTAARRVIRTRR